MRELETGDSPSYEEIMERFGSEVKMRDALEKTAYLQREYPELTAIGSVIASEEVYGKRDMRDTSQALDFVADPNTIQDIISEQDETWQYSGSYVWTTKEKDEWMVAAIPCNESVFQHEDFNSFSVDSYNVMAPETVPTRYGEINVVPAELGIASKLRRYVMQKRNRGNFKKSDLVDVANILARNRDDELINYEQVKRNLSNQVGHIPNKKATLQDAVESLEQNSDASEEEIEAGLREIKKVL